MNKIKKFTEINDKLISDWKKLWKKSPNANIVNSPYWLLSAINTFEEKNILIIAAYDEQNNLTAVAPFIIKKIFGIPFFTVPASEFADKNSILADFNDQALINSLFKEILSLGNIYLTEYTLDKIQNIQHSIKALSFIKNDVNPYIDFSKGKYGELSNKRRNNLLHRLENTKTNMEFIISSPENINKCLDISFDIEKTSSKQHNGKGVFFRPEVQKFYKSLVKMAPNNVPVSLLYLNNTPVSYLIGFHVNNTYQATQKAYLAGYEYFNPGKIQMIKLIDYLYENGNPAIEMGRGYDRFKRDFSKNYHEQYNLIISKSPLVRFYITNLLKLRIKTYEFIIQHTKPYRLFKKIKNHLKKLKPTV